MVYDYDGKLFTGDNIREQLKKYMLRGSVVVNNEEARCRDERVRVDSEYINVRRTAMLMCLEKYDKWVGRETIEYDGTSWDKDALEVVLRESRLVFKDGLFWIGVSSIEAEGVVDDIKETIIKGILDGV